MKIITKSEKETFALAKKLAKTLKGGEVIGLIGELGAGKTIFTKGLAAGLGIKNTVNSPTFVIMKVYETKGKIERLVHIDAYRLQSATDLEAIGALDSLKSKNTITVIEWPKKIESLLPKDSILIDIKNLSENERMITKH